MVKVHCSLNQWLNLVLNTIYKADENHKVCFHSDIVEIQYNGKTVQFMWAYA